MVGLVAQGPRRGLMQSHWYSRGSRGAKWTSNGNRGGGGGPGRGGGADRGLFIIFRLGSLDDAIVEVAQW